MIEYTIETRKLLPGIGGDQKILVLPKMFHGNPHHDMFQIVQIQRTKRGESGIIIDKELSQVFEISIDIVGPKDNPVYKCVEVDDKDHEKPAIFLNRYMKEVSEPIKEPPKRDNNTPPSPPTMRTKTSTPNINSDGQYVKPEEGLPLFDDAKERVEVARSPWLKSDTSVKRPNPFRKLRCAGLAPA